MKRKENESELPKSNYILSLPFLNSKLTYKTRRVDRNTYFDRSTIVNYRSKMQDREKK